MSRVSGPSSYHGAEPSWNELRGAFARVDLAPFPPAASRELEQSAEFIPANPVEREVFGECGRRKKFNNDLIIAFLSIPSWQLLAFTWFANGESRSDLARDWRDSRRGTRRLLADGRVALGAAWLWWQTVRLRKRSWRNRRTRGADRRARVILPRETLIIKVFVYCLSRARTPTTNRPVGGEERRDTLRRLRAFCLRHECPLIFRRVHHRGTVLSAGRVPP